MRVSFLEASGSRSLWAWVLGLSWLAVTGLVAFKLIEARWRASSKLSVQPLVRDLFVEVLREYAANLPINPSVDEKERLESSFRKISAIVVDPGIRVPMSSKVGPDVHLAPGIHLWRVAAFFSRHETYKTIFEPFVGRIPT